MYIHTLNIPVCRTHALHTIAYIGLHNYIVDHTDWVRMSSIMLLRFLDMAPGRDIFEAA